MYEGRIRAGRGPTMRAFGYCRVSSVGQATEGVSLDAQRPDRGLVPRPTMPR